MIAGQRGVSSWRIQWLGDGMERICDWEARRFGVGMAAFLGDEAGIGRCAT